MIKNLPPLVLERRLDARLWGGDMLAGWMGLASAPAPLAEAWLVYDQNRVVGGPLAGWTLAEAAAEFGPALLGARSFDRYGAEFPLLAKFLDAGDNLSVQVHPDDGYARVFEADTGFQGKTEAWHILRAVPGAFLYHGFAMPTDRAAIAEAVGDGTLLGHLRRVPVVAGDTILIPAGTIHALNAGLMIFEIQQRSDLTYRLYDYDRRGADGAPRQLHIQRALDVIAYGDQPPPKTQPRRLNDTRALLVECAHFRMERWELGAPLEATTRPETFEIATIVDGAARLISRHGEVMLRRGDAVVLPASLGAYRLIPAPGAAALVCSVPE